MRELQSIEFIPPELQGDGTGQCVGYTQELRRCERKASVYGYCHDHVDWEDALEWSKRLKERMWSRGFDRLFNPEEPPKLLQAFGRIGNRTQYSPKPKSLQWK